MLVNEHKCAASDAGALRFNQAQHCMGSNRGINGMATFFQHLDRCGDGMWIRCRDDRPAVPGSAGTRASLRFDSSS
jgi:hypothetical protein